MRQPVQARGAAGREGAPQQVRQVPAGRKTLAGVEVGLACVAVLLDLLVPALVILLLAALSLLVRGDGLLRGWTGLGLRRIGQGVRVTGELLLLSVAWTLLVLGLLMPLLEHATGRRQDLSQFDDVESNLPLLLVLVLLSWTLGAFVEELAFRGYLLTRLRELLPRGRAGLALAVCASSMLFGLVHTEQGIVGVVLTTLDALWFSGLRLRYGSLWASVLAHGFNNTIGLTAFFVVGPVYGLW